MDDSTDLLLVAADDSSVRLDEPDGPAEPEAVAVELPDEAAMAPPTADMPESPPVVIEAPAADDPPTLSAARILQDRPDVTAAFLAMHDGSHAHDHSAFATAWGDDSPEAYAKFWYERHGRQEGYSQGATTASDVISIDRILEERPDVFRSFYREFYDTGTFKAPDAWIEKVGGTTVEDYARYWYDWHGKWEGYRQSPDGETLDVNRLLSERGDVLTAYFEGHSGLKARDAQTWDKLVGGPSYVDYAKYWYNHYGQWEGYTQRTFQTDVPPEQAPPPEDAPAPEAPAAEPGAPAVDPEPAPAEAVESAAPDVENPIVLVGAEVLDAGI